MKIKGFTLIELLVVMSIISILATVGLVSFQAVGTKARDSQRKSDLSALAQALEIYYQKNSQYIGGIGNCNDTTAFYGSITIYMKGSTVPKDPLSQTNYCYQSVGNGTSFRLYAKLENCSDSEIIGACSDNYNFSVTSPDLISSVFSEPSPSPAPSQSPFKRVFTTATTYTGNLGGVSGANNTCNTLGSTALPGTSWKAWISDATVSPANQGDGDSWTQFSDAYKLVDGITTIAASWTKLIDGTTHLTAINKDQNNIVISSITTVWTNTTTAGGITSTTNTCTNWSGTSGSGQIGNTNAADSRWTNLKTGGCTDSYRLYCFEQ